MCESHFLIGGREVEVIPSGEAALIGKVALQLPMAPEHAAIITNQPEEIPAETEMQYGSINN